MRYARPLERYREPLPLCPMGAPSNGYYLFIRELTAHRYYAEACHFIRKRNTVTLYIYNNMP